MVKIPFDHLIHHGERTLHKEGIVCVFSGQASAPDRDLAPEEHSPLIQQIDPVFTLGVMRAAYSITAHLQDDVEIFGHQFVRESEAPFRVLLVAVDPLQVELLAVQQNLLAPGLHGAEANAVRQVVLACYGTDQVELRLSPVPIAAGLSKLGLRSIRRCRRQERAPSPSRTIPVPVQGYGYFR